MKRNFAFLVLPLVLLSLLAGLLSGLVRIGWYELSLPEINGEHGAIMVGSFLGTLICLERTVVLKNKWLYLIPILCGLSLVFFFSGNSKVAYLLQSFAAVGLVGIFYHFYHQYKEIYLLVMLVGAVAWLTGNLIMFFHDLYPLAVNWWIGFLLLTITGERIELTKFLPRKELKSKILITGNAIFLLGILMPFHTFGRYISVLGLAITAIGLFQFDIARKSVKKEGLTRFSALGLLSGYVWLLITGFLLLLLTEHPFGYDAALHAFFLGFVFSMIFAHGPIILPGVVGINFKPYHPVLYLWLAILQLTLAVRIIADFSMLPELRRITGMVNGIGILAYFVTLMVLVRLQTVKMKKVNNSNKIAV